MKPLALIGLVLGLGATVQGNPSVAAAHTLCYLSSERVAVTISQTGALVRATFTFRFEPERLDYVKKDGAVSISVPIWLSDTDPESPTVTEFWKTFGIRFRQGLNQANRHCFYETLAFSATLRSRHLEGEAAVECYSSHPDDPIASRIYSARMLRPELVTFKPEGAACVSVVFACEGVDLPPNRVPGRHQPVRDYRECCQRFPPPCD